MKDKSHMTLAESLSLAEELLVESIYNTAKLEGVSTTFPATRAILDGVNVPGAKQEDIQVILNLRDGWQNILDITTETKIDLEFIKKINSKIASGDSSGSGKLRRGKASISGTNHKPTVPVAREVEIRIDMIMTDDTKSTTERAIDLALYIVYEQIFGYGNNQTANLAANAVLIQGGAGVMSVPTIRLVEFNRLLTGYYDTHKSEALKEFLYSRAVVDFESQNDTLKPPNEEILRIIRSNPAVTYDELADLTGRSRTVVARTIADLRAVGHLRREGSDKSGTWVALD